MECKICKRAFNSLNSLSLHLKIHNTNLIDYSVKFENFKIPSCLFCSDSAQIESGLKFKRFCNDKNCRRKAISHSEETKKKIRNGRINYLKSHPEDTAWRLGNKMSFPEKYFSDALKLNGYFDKFEIVREKSFFPYYADFAFENAKIVVEIDGSQHEKEDRRKRDALKDENIKKSGWRVIRFKANQVLGNIAEVLLELDNFIGDISVDSKTSEIITEKEKKRNSPKIKKPRIKKENKKNFQKRLRGMSRIEERNQKFDSLLKSNIDFSREGWVLKSSRILGISSQKVTPFLRKNFFDFWLKNCKKRKNTTIPLTK